MSLKYQIVATKEVKECGTSLVFFVTKECAALGITRGDMVRITIEPVRSCHNCGNCQGWIDEGYGMGEYDCKLGDDCPEEQDGQCPGWIPIKKNVH